MDYGARKIILGIDPGIERLGWGLIKKDGNKIERIDSGVKKTSKEVNKSERIEEIYDFICNLLKKHKPDTFCTEKLFFAKNVKTASVVGEARGVILLAAQKHKLIPLEIAPNEIKIAVCGYGHATKNEIARMLKMTLSLPKKTILDDETDALAIALTGAFYRSYP